MWYTCNSLTKIWKYKFVSSQSSRYNKNSALYDANCCDHSPCVSLMPLGEFCMYECCHNLIFILHPIPPQLPTFIWGKETLCNHLTSCNLASSCTKCCVYIAICLKIVQLLLHPLETRICQNCCFLITATTKIHAFQSNHCLKHSTNKPR